MANNFKRGIDRQSWIQVSPSPNAHASGQGMAVDLRSDISRNPFIYQLVSATVLNRYNVITKSWNLVGSPALIGTYGTGAGAVFAPSLGITGSIGSGSSTTSVVTTTTLGSPVAPNMLANRGGSGEYGFKVRIVSPSQGKTEERWIVANSGGATPTLVLDTPLSFTPASGDSYEMMAGRLFMMGAGTLGAGSWKSWELSTNYLETKSQVNLPATISTDFSGIALDEQYTPYNREPGEGFVVGATVVDGKKCLQATAAAASTITGQASAGDADVLANEYRNFQIRIVEDTTNKTAVGQRRVIASHTAGASPVYTLGSAWTVTPSSSAKFVIEYPNLIIVRISAGQTQYVYNYGTGSVTNGTNTIAANAWHTTYFAPAPATHGAGVMTFPSFGIEVDPSKYARHSYNYCFRGGNTTLDLFDIAGGTTGAWTADIVYDGKGMVSPWTGSTAKYAPTGNEGRFGYMNAYAANAINQIYRFDVKNRVLMPFTSTDWVQTGTASVGDRLATIAILDGSDKYTMVFLMSHNSALSQEIIVQT